jgi:hypothetical protein
VLAQVSLPTSRQHRRDAALAHGNKRIQYGAREMQTRERDTIEMHCDVHEGTGP